MRTGKRETADKVASPARSAASIARLLALALLLAAAGTRAGGEFKAHGFTLPGGAVKVDDERYRLAQAWDDARRFYRSVYPPAKFPRSTLPNTAGVRAEHIENPGGGAWEGVNIYENKGEVRVFILKRKAAHKGKELEEGEAPED
jgi:hypothetical protein